MSNCSQSPIKCVIRAITKRATLVVLEDGEEKWIPFSVIAEEDLADLELNADMELNVANWFYERELM